MQDEHIHHGPSGDFGGSPSSDVLPVGEELFGNGVPTTVQGQQASVEHIVSRGTKMANIEASGSLSWHLDDKILVHNHDEDGLLPIDAAADMGDVREHAGQGGPVRVMPADSFTNAGQYNRYQFVLEYRSERTFEYSDEAPLDAYNAIPRVRLQQPSFLDRALQAFDAVVDKILGLGKQRA